MLVVGKDLLQRLGGDGAAEALGVGQAAQPGVGLVLFIGAHGLEQQSDGDLAGLVDTDGELIGYSIDSVIPGGEDFYDAKGNHIGYGIESITGMGENLYSDESGHIGYTIESITGCGNTFYSDDKGYAGYAIDSITGMGSFGEYDNDIF